MFAKVTPYLLLVLVVGTVGWMVFQKDGRGVGVLERHGTPLVMYKSPYCSCCGSWGSYMDRKGYDVTVKVEKDMSLVKEQYQVPYELESCHTAEVAGYVVEGHVPDEAIEKLLTERPDIKGIGMAGMPSGSPGMPGAKEDFLIYEITHEGEKGDLFMQL